MSSIPEYKSRQPLNQPVDTSLRGQAQLTQEIGQGISGLLGKGADIVFEARMAEEQIRKDTFIKENFLSTQKSIEALSREIRQDKKFVKNPQAGREAFQTRAKEIIYGLADNAPFPSAKKDFLSSANNLWKDATIEIERWVDGRNLEENIFATDNLSSNQVADVYRDPFSDETYKRVLDEMSMLADSFGVTMDPTLVDSKGREYRKKAVAARFQGGIDIADKIIDSGPLKGETHNQMLDRANKVMDRVSSMLESKEYDYDLGADGISNVRSAIKRFQHKKASAAKDYDMMRFTDPWKFLYKMQERVPPIPVGDSPASVQQGIEQRFEWVQPRNKKYAMDAPLVTREEKFFYENKMPTLPVEQQVEIVRGLGLNDTPATKKYLSDLAQINSVYAGAAAISREPGAGQVLEDILRGESLLQKDKATGQPSVVAGKFVDASAAVSKYMKGVILSPDAVNRLGSVVHRAAVGAAIREGKDPSMLNETDYQAQAKKILGGRQNINGSEVFSPRANRQIKNEKGEIVANPGDFLSQYYTKRVFQDLTQEQVHAVYGQTLKDATGNTVDLGGFRGRLVPRQTAKGYRLFLLQNGGEVPLYFQADPKSPEKSVPAVINPIDIIEKFPPVKGWLDKVLHGVFGEGDE